MKTIYITTRLESTESVVHHDMSNLNRINIDIRYSGVLQLEGHLKLDMGWG